LRVGVGGLMGTVRAGWGGVSASLAGARGAASSGGRPEVLVAGVPRFGEGPSWPPAGCVGGVLCGRRVVRADGLDGWVGVGLGVLVCGCLRAEVVLVGEFVGGGVGRAGAFGGVGGELLWLLAWGVGGRGVVVQGFAGRWLWSRWSRWVVVTGWPCAPTPPRPRWWGVVVVG